MFICGKDYYKIYAVKQTFYNLSVPYFKVLKF